MSISDVEWWFSDRDNALRRAMEAEAAARARSNARHRSQIRQLTSQLQGVGSDLRVQLNALQSAFVAFVELDALRQQLAQTPDLLKMRGWALADLETLTEGGIPPERPDVEGHWLPPAVAALRPDGSLDPRLAAVARERDDVRTRRLHVLARAALGQGAAVAAEIPELMQIRVTRPEPTNRSLGSLRLATDKPERRTWDEGQVALWGAVLRGAFGPQALPLLLPVLQEALASDERNDEWLRRLSDSDTVKTALTATAAANEALADAIEEVAPISASATAGSEDTRWRMRLTDLRRFTGTLGSPVEEPEPEADAEPETVVDEVRVVTPEEAWSDTQGALLGAAAGVIQSESDHDLDAMLASLARLERRFEDPLGPAPADEEPAAHDVAELVRATAADEHASPRDRRLMWQAITCGWQGQLAEAAEAPAPRPEALAGRSHGIDVTAKGYSTSDVRRREQVLEERFGLSLPQRHALPIMVTGGVLAVLGLVLLFAGFSVPTSLTLLAVGIAVAIAGHHFRTTRQASERSRLAEGDVRSQVERLHEKLAASHQRAVEEHEAEVAAAQRALRAVRRLG
ncbi:hypothetical protein [Parenemella sanctibonifatiensis]|uniref:Uncharacterized protein n=1 Tax=Parenemella sanctibonifatiensis TaxID=2016505 RepID=A0A255EMA9_9ACTN|nr:hypothetical protein [Parenemella sanctibonifatiensis]OYN92678.1 hypothetical protein CGZ91_04195 [Parenemella sanctibonifatiensis]